MSVFKTDEPLDKRVKVLEKKVRQLEALVGKKPEKQPELRKKEEEEDFCVIS